MTGKITMTEPVPPRDALIKVLKGVMIADFGHDLPDAEFYCEPT
jgi:hypothetical protein